MTDPKPREMSDSLKKVRAARARVEELEKQLKQAKEDLRFTVVEARRADGELVADIQEASGWSHSTVNTVMRDAGIPPDRSAPRKRKPACK